MLSKSTLDGGQREPSVELTRLSGERLGPEFVLYPAECHALELGTDGLKHTPVLVRQAGTQAHPEVSASRVTGWQGGGTNMGSTRQHIPVFFTVCIIGFPSSHEILYLELALWLGFYTVADSF